MQYGLLHSRLPAHHTEAWVPIAEKVKVQSLVKRTAAQIPVNVKS